MLACFSRREFTKESIEEFAATSLAAPATLVSDGLGCFKAVQGMGILHERHVTGGGAASTKRPEFMAVNTVLGNLKTAFAGTCHAFGFAKYAHRYLAQVQYLFNRTIQPANDPRAAGARGMQLAAVSAAIGFGG